MSLAELHDASQLESPRLSPPPHRGNSPSSQLDRILAESDRIIEQHFSDSFKSIESDISEDISDIEEELDSPRKGDSDPDL